MTGFWDGGLTAMGLMEMYVRTGALVKTVVYQSYVVIIYDSI